MKVYILKTKTNFYVYCEDTYYLRKEGKVHPMTEEEKAERTAWAIEFKFWDELEADSIDSAIKTWQDAKEAERKAKAKESAEWQAKHDQELQAKWDKLMKLDVIPVTFENLKTVASILNKQNWGTWKLPKMSIGYSAHQYDCDGKQATTITLDKPVLGKTKFKVGGKRGHLNKYQSL